MGYGFFILLNAILFIRPAEMIPSLQPFRLYQLAILGCLACSYPQVLAQLDSKSLTRRPISLCVVMLLAAIVMSHLANGFIYGARTSGFEFFKIVLYYFLLVVNLDRPERYQKFLNWLVLFMVVAASMALLQFYGYVNIPALAAYEQREIDPITGEVTSFPRLCSTGIFNDPNDVCLLLSAGIMLCVYRVMTPGAGPKRFLWCAPIVLFMLAFIETKSRGGFISLVTAISVLMASRIGMKKTVMMWLMMSPGVLVVAGGRMTNIDVADGTGQHRIQLWREALALVREFPLFGVGQGLLHEYTRLVAHNSYVHAFAELGLFGGSCFISIVFLSASQLFGLRKHEEVIVDSEMRRFRPYMLGILAGFCTGIMTLSRVYIVPTYMIFGLVSAYLQQAQWQPQQEPANWQFNGSLFGRLFAVSITALLVLEFGSRIMVRWEH